MIPRTLSASSLQVAELCMDRWKAEYIDRAPSFSNSAADVGTAFHGAAEYFVKAVYIDKTHAGLTRVEQKELMVSFFQMSYVQTFGSADFDTPEYKDGFNLAMRWFQRTTFDHVVMVESAELKETIKVPYNHPDGIAHVVCENCLDAGTPGVCYINFNYIMDRVDVIGEEQYEVVDYKTIRVPLQPEDLDTKLQARAYALAIQIKHPNAVLVKATFDQIRHERISLTFTRDDNIRFWRFLCTMAQKIVDTREEDIVPQLNTECGYCVKKYTCPEMLKNIGAGGIMSLTIDEKAIMVGNLKDQTKANKRIIDDLEEQLMRHAAEIDELEWDTENGARHIKIGSRRARVFPHDRAVEIMGDDLYRKVGSITLGKLDDIIKDESQPTEVREGLAELLAWTTGNLYVEVKPKKASI